MNTATSRTAGAAFFALLAAPSSRAAQRRSNPLTRHITPQSRRAVASSTRQWQQQPVSPTSNPGATTTTPPSPAPPRPSPPPQPTSIAPRPQPTPSSSPPDIEPQRSLTESLADPPPVLNESEKQVDWTRSFHGLSATPFTPEQAAILQQELSHEDVEIKPDGIIYLPEIKYRRILNKAFGPGGWGLAPRGETIVTGKVVTREYGLVAGGRLVSVARGEQAYFDADGIPTATEGCKSNALMRCCKDLGIASELWDPRFIRKFLKSDAKETLVENVNTRKRRKHWMRKDDEIRWPLKEVPMGAPAAVGGGGGAPTPAGGYVKR